MRSNSMKKTNRKIKNKTQKNTFEIRFNQMVKEYNQSNEALASLTEGTDEYIKQGKVSKALFAKAERFLKTHQ